MTKLVALLRRYRDEGTSGLPRIDMDITLSMPLYPPKLSTHLGRYRLTLVTEQMLSLARRDSGHILWIPSPLVAKCSIESQGEDSYRVFIQEDGVAEFKLIINIQ